MSFFLEPAFWIFRVSFVLILYFYSTSSGRQFSLPIDPFWIAAGCSLLWIAAGFALIGARQGESHRAVFFAFLLDLAAAVLLARLVPSVTATAAFLLPFLDAALGEMFLFAFAGGLGCLELLFVRETYFRFMPLLVSLLFGVYLSRYYRQSRRSKTLLSLIEVGQGLGSKLDLKAVLESFQRVIDTLYHYNAFIVYLADESNRMLRVSINQSPLPSAFTDFGIDAETIIIRVLKTHEGILVQDLRRFKDPFMPPLRSFRSAAVMPLQFEGSPLGVFVLINPYPGYFEAEDLRILAILANQVSIALKNVRLHEKTAFLAITDSLTGVHTHGYFQGMLGDFISNQAREHKPVSVLMMDVDWFKRVNDTFGHPEGDRVLAQLSRVIKNHLTPQDVLARYGGDEFVALIHDSNKMAAATLAERIRKTVEDVPFVLTGTGKSVRISVSIGVSSFPEDGTAGSVLVDLADKAMYQAKQTGRNKIVCAGQKQITAT